MDFDIEISRLESRQESLERELKTLRTHFEKAKEFTNTLLEKCKEKGITKVSICRRTERVPKTLTWPFGYKGNIFQYVPEEVRKTHDWPAIWSVVNELKISGGCGNGDQHQISDTNLIDGVYELKDGNFFKVE